MAVEGWKSSKLGDLCDIKIGGTPSRAVQDYWEQNPDSGHLWASISDLLNNPVIKTKEKISDQGVQKSNVKLIPAGTNLMSFKLTMGRVAKAGADLYTNEAIAAFLPKSNEIDHNYLYYILPQAAEGADHDQAVKGKTLNKEKLNALKVLVPPLSEQKKIAEILESVDNAIAKTESVITQTQRVKEGLLQQLLTRGIGHTKFKQSPLGEIPESWDILPIGDIATFYNGKAHEQDISEEGSHVVVNSKFISTEGEVRKFTNSPSLIAHSHDVLIVMSDIPNGKAIAKCFYVDQDNLYTVNQRIGLLRSKKDDPKFLFYALNRNPYFLSFDDGAKQTNLRKDEVLACPIALPKDVTEQREISECLSEIDNLIMFANRDLTELRLLKSGLMSDLLTGRVRVNVDAKSSNKIEEAA